MDSNLYLISLVEVPPSHVYAVKAGFKKSLGWIEILPNTFIIKSKRDVDKWTSIIEFYLQRRYQFVIAKIDREQIQGWLNSSLWDELEAL